MRDKHCPIPSDRRDKAEMDERLLVEDNFGRASAIGSKMDRAVLRSSWIQRLKPFASLEEEEEEEVVTSPGRQHVWTHFTKDFRSCSRRSNKSPSPFHVRSSSWPQDGVHSQEKLAQPLINNGLKMHPPTYVNIPFVPSDGRSTDLSWKTGNILLGQDNSHTKKHSSAEAIVPCFQNRETTSVEKPKDPYEASDTFKYKSDDDSFICHFHSEVKDDDRRLTGGLGFPRPPLHSRNIKNCLGTLKDGNILSQPRFLHYDGAHELVQDEIASDNCRKSLHCSNLDGDKEAPMVVVSHKNKFNTSIMLSQDSHGIKLQNQKATSKTEYCQGKSRLKTAVNFGFLLFPQYSTARLKTTNNAKNVENNSDLKSNVARPHNIPRICTVGFNQVATAENPSTMQGCESLNAINGTDHIQSYSSYKNFVSINEKTGTTPLHREISRPSLPETNIDDNWGNWMDIFVKSTPVMPEEANSSTASLPQEYILEEYRKQQLKLPASVIKGKQSRDILMSNEIQFLKTRNPDLCSIDMQRKTFPPTLKDNGNFSGHDHAYEGASGNTASNIGDIKKEQKSQFDDPFDSQRSCSTQQVWIQRWSPSSNIHASSSKVASVFPESKRNSCSDLLIDSKPNISSSVRSQHSKKKNTIQRNHEIADSVTAIKHGESAPAYFGSARQTSGTTLCGNKSNVNTFGNSMSRSAEAMAIVGSTANKSTLIQRKGPLSVWPCPTAILTTEVEHRGINEDKLRLNMDGL